MTLPLIAPGIAAGAFLAFMASIDNVPVSLFLSNARTDMLPIRMWGMMESTLDVRVAAVSGVLIACGLRADADHGMDGGPHPPHARLREHADADRRRSRSPQEAFAPFGDVIDVPDRPRPHLLRGRARQPARPTRTPSLSVASRPNARPPLKAELLERHEFSSQTFVPLDVGALADRGGAACRGGRPGPRAACSAFIATGEQGVTYRPNTWHHGLTVLDGPGRFAVFMWRDGGTGDEEFVPVEPFTILIPYRRPT